MANTTPNIGLIQPVDGAAQWGLSLNDNFGIIDSKIKDSIEIATTQFISAGLYKSPQTPFTVSDSTITTELLKCFFPSLITDTSLSDPDILPGTVNYTLSLNINNPAFDMLQKYKLESIAASESGLETFYLENLDNLAIGMTANIYISDGTHNKTYTNIGTVEAIDQQDNTLLITTSIIETEVDINNLKNSYIWFDELINTKYKNFFIGLRTISATQIIPIITTSASEFNISNGNDIYLGSVVVSNEEGTPKFVNKLAIFKPWFCNFSSNNRGIDIANHGILTNGKIEFIENNKKSLRPIEQFNWQHEGINYSNEAMPHYREGLVEVDSEDKIQFFRAYDNAVVSNDELELRTELDGSKWLNGTTEDDVDTNYYTIQRYCILENGKSVVFYGKKQFATKDAALSQLPFLQPLNVMVICKEAARIIVQNSDSPDNIIINLNQSEDTTKYGYFKDDQLTIYNDNEGTIKFKAQDNKNIYLTPDPYKTSYTIADAAENRSSGIWPTNASFSLGNNNNQLSIENNDIYGGFVSNNFNNSPSTITNFIIPQGSYSLTGGTIPTPASTGWYALIIEKANVQKANPFSIVNIQKIYSNAIIIGYLYYNGSYYTNKMIAPDIITTLPSTRINYTYGRISANGFYGTINNNALNVSAGIINAEGINYQSWTNTNIQSFIGTINWSYIDSHGVYISTNPEVFDRTRCGSAISPETVGTDKYTIQRVLIGADGKWFISYGNQQYNTKEAAIEGLATDNIFIDSNLMLEVMALILQNSDTPTDLVYYTNKKYLGNLQIQTIDPGNYNDFTFEDFSLYSSNHSQRKLTYRWEGPNNDYNVSVPVYSNGFGIANQFIASPTAGDDNKCIVYNNTNNQFGYAMMATSNELSDLETRVSNLETLISSFVTYSTNAPESGNHIGQIAYTDLGSGQYEVKFWNGIKWEKLNTWQ